MSRIPNPRRTLTGEIKKTQTQVRRASNASVFTGTGFHPNGQGGMDSDNYVEGEAGFSLRGADGYLEVNDVRIRGGIIGNDALTDPVVPYVAHRHVNDFEISPTAPDRATITVPVPAGYTRAQVTCTATGIGYNTTASSDFLYVFANIEGDPDQGYGAQCTVEPGGLGTGTQCSTAILTGLSGSFDVSASVTCQYGTWPASPASGCNVDVSVLFLR